VAYHEFKNGFATEYEDIGVLDCCGKSS